MFDKIVITSDDEYFDQYCGHGNVEFHKRTTAQASSNTSTDTVMDIMFAAYDCESMLWVNSVSPLQSIEDITNCASTLSMDGVDAVMAVNTLRQHCAIGGTPINYDPNVAFEKTQDLMPVQRFVYSCMGWNRETYVSHRANGFPGLFPGNLELVEVSVNAGMLVKYREDFDLFKKIDSTQTSDELQRLVAEMPMVW